MEKTGRIGSALVTGGSRGIGRAIALRLARTGRAVAINYRDSADLADDVASIIRAAGGTALTLQADVSDPESASALVCRAEEALGPLDVVVSNAGITRDRLLIQMSEADWSATWMTDLVGARALCRRALSAMSARGHGSIIAVSSVVGTTGNPGQANYAAAKAGLQGLSRQLAVEAAPSGVTVNCVVPGFFPTDAVAHLTPEQRDAWIGRVPMGREGPVDDIAELVAFLSGDGARYITGQCIAVDGGYQASLGFGFGS
ncbi:MAG TPA: 3-oxoacyl-ACP reductase FabG [Chloroflexota bacterium]|nr:3-oxoacyl-ACP reductase FabG [Chloroflexota bacterium]